jgi:hypothetical protein
MEHEPMNLSLRSYKNLVGQGKMSGSWGLGLQGSRQREAFSLEFGWDDWDDRELAVHYDRSGSWTWNFCESSGGAWTSLENW